MIFGEKISFRAFLLTLIIGAIFLVLLREALRLYGIANEEVKLGVITAFGSAVAFLIAHLFQTSRERKARLFEAKREAYAQYFRFFMSIFGRLENNPVTEQEMIDAIRSIATEIMTWGDAKTINAFNIYQKQNSLESTEQKHIFENAEFFLRALRKDLGHTDQDLEYLALTKMNLKGNDHSDLDKLKHQK